MNAEISTPQKDIFSLRLSATRRGARLARHLALRQLAEWGLPYDSSAAEAVATVVAELAANAITHGRVPGRDFELSLALTDQAIRIEVNDARAERRPPAPESLAPPAPDAESGRGLLLVQALSSVWGIAPREVGKTVWAEVPTGGL